MVGVSCNASRWNAVTRLVGEWRPTDTSAVTVVIQRNRSSSGQGFSVDPKIRLALERHAVDTAITHYKASGYDVEERGKPYDLKCTKGAEVLHVEVKGTQTEGEEILLTPNEVNFAANHPDTMELFVVACCTVIAKMERTTSAAVAFESSNPGRSNLLL